MRYSNRLLLTIAFTALFCSPLYAQTVTPTPVSPTHQIDLRLAGQWKEIQLALRNSKMKPQQSFALKATLKKVRMQEISDFKQNGTHTLTTDQQAALNTMLDQNEQAIQGASGAL